MTRKVVTYIKADCDDSQAVIQELATRTGVDFIRFKTVGELFSSLSNPQFTSNLIILDLDNITTVDGANLYEIVNTVSTLIKCTVERVKPGRPVRRSIPIAVSAHLDTDPTLFKQISGTDVIGIYPSGDKFTIDDKITALTALIDGQHYVPPAIIKLIRPSTEKKKTTANKKPTITLTARQAQVLQLICERGASNKVIAKTLKISESTVKLHVTAVFKKYGVTNRTQLAVFSKQKELT